MNVSKLAIFCINFLFLFEIYTHAAVDSDQLIQILQLVDEKKYAEAIEGYEKFLQSAPKPLHGPVQFEMATLHAGLGETEKALKMMQKSIESGFDDCIAVAQYTEWKSIKSNPQFQSLHEKIRISEADLKELYWLKAEIEHVNHDTKMMITENMNRKDTHLTTIPQSGLPVRPTSSTGVLFNRELLKIMHEVQRFYVMQSDQARMEHVTAMAMIAGGTSQEQILESARLADLAAQERQRAIQARKFSLPPGAGTTPRSCAEWK
jgi:hypothetical protein